MDVTIIAAAAEKTLAGSYWVGIIAGICFVIGFALLNFRVLTGESVLYQALNFVGAAGFVYTALLPFNPGLFITEFAWAVVALIGLWKILTGVRRRQGAAGSGPRDLK